MLSTRNYDTLRQICIAYDKYILLPTTNALRQINDILREIILVVYVK